MFCTHCGASIATDQRFCGSCGKAVEPDTVAPVGTSPVAPSVRSTSGRVARHLRTLGVLWIALSAPHLLRGAASFVGARMAGIVGQGWFDDASWGWPVGHFIPALLTFVGLASLLLAAAGFTAGWGVLERHPWARTLALILAFIALLNPILGTALGIYTLWVLLPSDAEVEWRRTATHAR